MKRVLAVALLFLSLASEALAEGGHLPPSGSGQLPVERVNA